MSDSSSVAVFVRAGVCPAIENYIYWSDPHTICPFHLIYNTVQDRYVFSLGVCKTVLRIMTLTRVKFDPAAVELSSYETLWW